MSWNCASRGKPEFMACTAEYTTDSSDEDVDRGQVPIGHSDDVSPKDVLTDSDDGSNRKFPANKSKQVVAIQGNNAPSNNSTITSSGTLSGIRSFLRSSQLAIAHILGNQSPQPSLAFCANEIHLYAATNPVRSSSEAIFYIEPVEGKVLPKCYFFKVRIHRVGLGGNDLNLLARKDQSSNRRYSCSFTTEIEGDFAVSVCLIAPNVKHVNGSPLNFEVVSD